MTLPYLTPDVAPIDAEFRGRLEDFEVEEIPAYGPSHEGDHVLVRIEKRGLTTRDAVRALCAAVGADPAHAGWAGLKDKHAVTRQWVSLFRVDPDAVRHATVAGVVVLEAARHSNKLRTGHLRANRFWIRLRHFDSSRLDDLREVMSQIERRGLPNFYGEQRFGRDGDNVERALRWVRDGARAPRSSFQRKLQMSALQAGLFNRRVAQRLQEGTLATICEGELVKKHDTGGEFVAEDLHEAQRRADAWEISPTGPIFGAKMRWPTGRARADEEQLLASEGLTLEHFRAWKRIAPGARRFVRIPVPDVGLEHAEGTIRLHFTLPAGSYATILMREILKRDAPARESS